MNPGGIFDETYKVLAVENETLILQGIQSGDVLTINSALPGSFFSEKEYPVGQLVALSDPSTNLPN